MNNIKMTVAVIFSAMCVSVVANAAEPSVIVNISKHSADITQQQEITAILREIEYLREVASSLAKKHSNDKSKIRFNYAALIAQLNATENGIKAYLNAQIDAIHVDEPKPVRTQLFQVRQN